MNTVTMNVALSVFAKEIGAGRDKQVVLLLDGAPSHTSGALKVPDGVHLVFQPAYSPEVQPSERLWPLLRESIANRCFEDIEALEQQLSERCRQLDKQPDLIRRSTCYHWWPQDVLAA